jgi:hypothetical protein
MRREDKVEEVWRRDKAGRQGVGRLIREMEARRRDGETRDEETNPREGGAKTRRKDKAGRQSGRARREDEAGGEDVKTRRRGET